MQRLEVGYWPLLLEALFISADVIAWCGIVGEPIVGRLGLYRLLVSVVGDLRSYIEHGCHFLKLPSGRRYAVVVDFARRCFG